MAGKVVELNDSNFEEQIKKGIVLVDFWAPWCGPCRSQVPIIEALAEKVDGKAIVAKLNVDDAASAAGKFGVMSIPTLIVFKDGAEAKRFVGVQSEEKLLEAMGL
jgi:thioredoxin 1